MGFGEGSTLEQMPNKFCDPDATLQLLVLPHQERKRKSNTQRFVCPNDVLAIRDERVDLAVVGPVLLPEEIEGDCVQGFPQVCQLRQILPFV